MTLSQKVKTKWKNFCHLQRAGQAAEIKRRRLLSAPGELAFDQFIELSGVIRAAETSRVAHGTAAGVALVLLTILLLCGSHILKVTPELRNALFPASAANTKYNVYATIYENNTALKTICLTTQDENCSFLIARDEENQNIIYVTNHSLEVLYSSCPDHECVKRGSLSYSPIPIICRDQNFVITFYLYPVK